MGAVSNCAQPACIGTLSLLLTRRVSQVDTLERAAFISLGPILLRASATDGVSRASTRPMANGLHSNPSNQIIRPSLDRFGRINRSVAHRLPSSSRLIDRSPTQNQSRGSHEAMGQKRPASRCALICSIEIDRFVCFRCVRPKTWQAIPHTQHRKRTTYTKLSTYSSIYHYQMTPLAARPLPNLRRM